MNNIGENLRIIRESLDLTQKQFAEKVGKSFRTIQNYETNKTPLDLEIIQNLAKIYNVNTNWLLTGSGEIFLNEEKFCAQELKSYNLSQEEINLIIGEFLTKPATRETILTLLRAKQGNKEVVKQLKDMLTGIEMAYEQICYS